MMLIVKKSRRERELYLTHFLTVYSDIKINKFCRILTESLQMLTR